MLKGKTAVITGASRGIGRAIALKMAQEGANVAVIYSGSLEAAWDVCEKIRALGANAEHYQCDVSNFSVAKETVKKIENDFGRIDILVNNAGITIDRLIPQMREEDFDRVMDVNLKGAFNMIRHIYINFAKKREGRIINITSVTGIMGNAGQANYAAAKAGMIGLTKSVAKELAGRNVTCNAIAPGFIETAMTEAMTPEAKKQILDAVPMKKWEVRMMLRIWRYFSRPIYRDISPVRLLKLTAVFACEINSCGQRSHKKRDEIQ